MLSVILLSMLMIYPLFVVWSGIWSVATTWIGFWIWSMRHWTGVRSGLLISILGKLSWFRLTVLTTMILLMWKGMGLWGKSSFKMLGLIFSSKLNWGSYIISIAKTASKKIGALIRYMKFLSREVALYHYKSTIHSWVEYCCHVWACAPSCYLELVGKIQKRICRTVDPSVAASLEPLVYRRNVASLTLFNRYYFGRCSSELAQLAPLSFSQGRSTRYSDRLHDFSVTISRCFKDVYVNSFFLHTAIPRMSLPIECFPLT